MAFPVKRRRIIQGAAIAVLLCMINILTPMLISVKLSAGEVRLDALWSIQPHRWNFFYLGKGLKTHCFLRYALLYFAVVLVCFLPILQYSDCMDCISAFPFPYHVTASRCLRSCSDGPVPPDHPRKENCSTGQVRIR